MQFLKLPFVIIFFTALMGCGKMDKSSVPQSSFPKDDLNQVFNAINNDVLAHSEAYENLEKASLEIGHRLTGTSNGKKAETFAYQLLKEYGYSDLEYFPFRLMAWSRGSVSLNINQKNDAYNVPVVSLAHSPLEYDGKASLVDAGNGLQSDFERVNVSGKIVLLNLFLDDSNPRAKNLHRTEKAAMAIEHGAAGLIFVNGVLGNVLLTGAASVTGELIPIPAVCIGMENGDAIRNALQNGPVQAHITMKNHADHISARNVIARIKGSTWPDEKIVLGGHLDSWDLSQGAIDNGIGSFTVIEIARVFKKLKLQPRRTVEFVLFMGEEQGLLGSSSMVEDHIKTGKMEQIKYMINLDMSGNAIGFRSMGRTEMEPWLKAIGQKISKIDPVFQNKVGGQAGLHSDHQPFLLEGVPILGIHSNLDPSVYQFYHSDGDNFNLVDKSHLENGARFIAMMVYALANAEQIPAKKFTFEQTREFLILQGLKEKLTLGKEWKWKN